MLFKIPFKTAFIILLGVCFALLVFHSLILFQIIPYDIVWGGRLNSYDEMLQFEIVSLTVNAALIVLLFFKSKHKDNMFITIILWIYVALFAFNTLGNMLSKNTFELIVFTPLTLILALLCARVALERSDV